MRLWSIHPKYLDRIGLIALWREALLAKSVLEGKTKGYRNHPQLERFKKSKNPIGSINTYLLSIFNESIRRGYKFDKNKIGKRISKEKIPINKGQVEYEFKLLKKKLAYRCPHKFQLLNKTNHIKINDIFYVVEGDIEYWEKVK